MRVMITGGTGFIGSHVAEGLLQDGNEVTILARDPGKVRGFVDRPGVGDAGPDVSDETAPRPDGLYGATKAATEAYLLAIAASEPVRGNVIRPGYTFGEPAVDGASIYTDRKLPDIVERAVRNERIHVTANDGTQFVWVGDLARLYTAVFGSDLDRRLLTAVSADFATWEDIARMAVDHVGSTSEIVVAESDIDPAAGRNDVSAIEDAFGFVFDSRPHLRDHVAYLADRARS